jgi:hypothetical protein
MKDISVEQCLGLLENEEVIVQDKKTKTWRLGQAKPE